MTTDSSSSTDETTGTVRGWFTGRLPQDWFTGPVDVLVDREEITVVGTLPPPEVGADASNAERAAAADGRARSFRESTREQRIAMTRLRQPERLVLDTLVAASVARSRSEALAWSVRLVGSNAEAWLGELREAMQQVDRVRAQGPDRTE